jgi:hypothetical protein
MYEISNTFITRKDRLFFCSLSDFIGEQKNGDIEVVTFKMGYQDAPYTTVIE